MQDTIQIPPSLGAMILPGTALFPGAMLPLYIFEPRYQLMLSEALETHRLFGLVSSLEDAEQSVSRGGIGVVRACVANEDGTSNLVLQGISRSEFSGFDEGSPYPKFSVKPLNSSNSCATSSTSLRKEILTLISKISKSGIAIPKPLQTSLSQAKDFCQFSDMAASCLVGDPSVRQRLIEELDSTHRLEVLAAYFTHVCAANQQVAD